MSKLYVRLLAVAAVLIALTGASFSIIGLAKLFAGAAISVAIMAGSLEFAKLVVTGFLYRYWGHINYLLRSYLCFAVVTLCMITSIGIFGYLSSAYQVSSIGLKTEELKIQTLQDEGATVNNQLQELRRFIDEIPKNRISRKYEFQKRYDSDFRSLRKKSLAIADELTVAKTKMFKTHADVGPVVYLAQALHADLDTVVKFLILIFVLVFDPLAICLIFCLNLAIRLREKYHGNEVKIAAHAMSTPVDHRRLRRVA